MFKRFYLSLVALLGLCGAVAVGNYTMTQGAGTTFGSVLIGGTVHYAQQLLCDLTTPAQCASVSAGGAVKVDGSAVTQPVSLTSTTITGTVAATQSGTWTVQPGNTANTTPWLSSISQGGNTAIVKAGNTFAGTEQAVGVAVTNTLASVTPGDGITTTVYGTAPAAPVIGVPLLWNGTTYDRQKSAGATGIAAVRQTDGTTNATMKAASTPAVASDTAMVVDQRPGTNISQSPYPSGAVPYTATATGTTAATTATLAGAASVTTYICGFSIRANATAAATGNATVTGVITATLNFTQWTAPNATGLGITEMIFSPCIPASGTNQSVAVVSAAPGTGGVVSVTAWGYKL